MYISLFETRETEFKVEGFLNLRYCINLTSLGNLKSVRGALDLFGCKNLTSLGNLESVRKYLDLNGCKNLTSLGNLESVWGIILSRNSKIEIPDHLKDKVFGRI